MKVKDLIKILSEMDQDAIVMHPGYEDGYDVVQEVKEVIVYPRVDDDAWWSGEYEQIEEWDNFYEKRYKKDFPIKAVVL